VGLPYTERALNETTGGGTPYGASHVCGPGVVPALTDHEKSLAQALESGSRVWRCNWPQARERAAERNTSRMNGIVSRRCAASAASSRVSSSSYGCAVARKAPLQPA